MSSYDVSMADIAETAELRHALMHSCTLVNIDSTTQARLHSYLSQEHE